MPDEPKTEPELKPERQPPLLSDLEQVSLFRAARALCKKLNAKLNDKHGELL